MDRWLNAHRFPPVRLLFWTLIVCGLSIFPNYYFSIVNINHQSYSQFLNNSFDGGLCDPDTATPSGGLVPFCVNTTDCTKTDPCDGKQHLALWMAITNAVFFLGMFVGSLCVPSLADRLGRKSSLMFWNSLIAAGASLIMSLTKWPSADIFILLIMGRFAAGYSVGLAQGLLPLYLTEISPSRYRGLLGSCQNLMISVNTLFSYVVALPGVLGNYWVPLHAIGIPFALALLCLSRYLPETPKYLLLNKHDEIGARRSLAFFDKDISDQQARLFHYKSRKVVEIFTHYRSEGIQAARYQITFREVLQSRHLRRPIVISCAVMLGSIATGVVAIFTYSTTMFGDLGLGGGLPQMSSIVLSLFNCAGAVAAMLLVDRVGRRVLLMVGLGGCIICDVLFMVVDLTYRQLIKVSPSSLVPANNALTAGSETEPESYTWLAILGVAIMIVHVTIYNVGPGTIMWFISSEMTPQSVRSYGVMAPLALNTGTLSILILLYPPLSETDYGGLIFLVFAILTTFCAVYLYFVLPETRNREIDDILRQWHPNRQSQRTQYLTTVFTLHRRNN